MKPPINLFFALTMGLLTSCGTQEQPKESVTLLGLTPDGTTNLVAATEMKEIVQEFLACFPDWDKPVTNGVPSELPFPYIFRVQFHLAHTNLSIPVYHKDPAVFPGLWRHPSGVHVYFEPEKSRRFLELVAMMSPSAKKSAQQIEKREAPKTSKEALERKERSAKILQQEGVLTIAHLPVIEDSIEAKARTKEEIAHRAIAVCITAVKGEGLNQATIDGLVKKFGADKFFSPKEAAFIKNPKPSQQDRVQFSWRYECLWVLLWSLGYVEPLDRPAGVCDVPKAVGFLRDRDTAQFIKDANLRPLSEILDQADLIYRYHWAVVDARLKKREAPGKLDAGVVQERHYVLNWLIGYMEQEWDEISTDT